MADLFDEGGDGTTADEARCLSARLLADLPPDRIVSGTRRLEGTFLFDDTGEPTDADAWAILRITYDCSVADIAGGLANFALDAAAARCVADRIVADQPAAVAFALLSNSINGTQRDAAINLAERLLAAQPSIPGQAPDADPTAVLLAARTAGCLDAARSAAFIEATTR